MERNSVCRHGLAATVASNVFPTTTTVATTVVPKTEVRRACMAGLVRNARYSAFPRKTTNLVTTLVTATVTKSAMMVSTDSVKTAH